MTKKDYELIAGSLKMTKSWSPNDFTDNMFRITCENMANSLNRNDPKFDRNKFLTACGI